MQWLSSFDRINSGTERRICGKLFDSSIPGLSTANDTTLGYSSSHSDRFLTKADVVAQQSKLALTNNSQLGLHPSPAVQQPLSSALSACSRQDSSLNNDYRRRNAIAVYYDGDAQDILTHMVEQVAAAQNALQRRQRSVDQTGPRSSQEISDSNTVIEKLSTVSDACYTAAFKLLQDGDASNEAQKAGSALHSMRHLLNTGVLRLEELKRAQQLELARLDDAMLPSTPLVSVDSLGSKLSPEQHIEVDDDYGDDDLALPTIRLANRRRI